MSVDNSREIIDSIAWYASLVGGAPLPYHELYRIVVFLAMCINQQREADAAAVLTMLRDHASTLGCIPYDVALLLAGCLQYKACLCESGPKRFGLERFGECC